MESEERSWWGFGPGPVNGAIVDVAAGGVHGRCCGGHWIVLWGFCRSVQYQGVARMK